MIYARKKKKKREKINEQQKKGNMVSTENKAKQFIEEVIALAEKYGFAISYPSEDRSDVLILDGDDDWNGSLEVDIVMNKENEEEPYVKPNKEFKLPNPYED